MRAPTPDNPLEGHRPRVGRRGSGGTMIGHGRYYATTLRCECGWTPGVQRSTGSNGTVTRPNECVSNEAPSKGGNLVAKYAYQDHVAEVNLMALLTGRPVTEIGGGWTTAPVREDGAPVEWVWMDARLKRR